jgi:hypothetical protein
MYFWEVSQASSKLDLKQTLSFSKVTAHLCTEKLGFLSGHP